MFDTIAKRVALAGVRGGFFGGGGGAPPPPPPPPPVQSVAPAVRSKAPEIEAEDKAEATEQRDVGERRKKRPAGKGTLLSLGSGSGEESILGG